VSEGVSVEQRLAALEAQISAIADERDEYRKLVLHLREENERLKRGLLGQKAERLPKNDAQLSLLMLGLALGSETDMPAPTMPAEQVVSEHTRAKPVRRPLPDHLPRERIEIEPPEVERDPDAFELIGTETRAVLERRPSSAVVV
jgi:transposase